jgi:hypothetical protein
MIKVDTKLRTFRLRGSHLFFVVMQRAAIKTNKQQHTACLSCFLLFLSHMFGYWTTGPIAKKVVSFQSNFFGSENVQVSAHVLQK